MKAIYRSLAMALVLMSCANEKSANQAERETDSSIKEAQSQSESSQIALPTEDEILRLLYNVPNGGYKEESKEFMTKDYWETLIEAWNVPSDGLDGIGSDAFLSEFLLGAGDESKTMLASVKEILTDGNRCSITINLLPLYIDSSEEGFVITFDKKLAANQTLDNQKPKALNLVYENGKWVIDDFNGTKELMKKYIDGQRKYFASQEWSNYYTEVLKQADEFGDTLAKQMVLHAIETVQHYTDSLKAVK